MEAAQAVAVGIGIAVGSSTLIGLAVRMILIPYLRTHLVAPMAVVRDQVKNSHDLNLRDDLDDKFHSLEGVLEGMDASHTRVLARIQWELIAFDKRLAAVEKKVQS